MEKDVRMPAAVTKPSVVMSPTDVRKKKRVNWELCTIFS
jgi:hypothetical protein